MWGVILKLATGRYLFKSSRDRKEWNQDEDHLLLITELVGELPRSIIKAGFLGSKYYEGRRLKNVDQGVLKPVSLIQVRQATLACI